MTAEKTPSKLAAAVSLGRRGGKQTSKKYGAAHFAKMGQIAAATKVKRYGRTTFYALIRFGFKPSQMTEKQREEALSKIGADRADRLRRKRQKTQ